MATLTRGSNIPSRSGHAQDHILAILFLSLQDNIFETKKKKVYFILQALLVLKLFNF